MEKIHFPRDIRVYIPLALLFLILLSILPKAGNFSYDYKKGMPWMYDDLVARFDFPVLKSSSQMEEDERLVRQSQPPFYRRDEAARRQAQSQASALPQPLSSQVSSVLQTVYSHGLCDVLSANAEAVCIYGSAGRIDTLPSAYVYTLQQARNDLQGALRQTYGEAADSLFEAVSPDRIFEPDLLYDEVRTQQELKKSLDNLATTSGIVYAGEVIIRRGEPVTAQTQNKLDSYRLEFDEHYGYDGNRVFLWIGNAVLAFLIVALLFFVILYTNAGIFSQFNRYYYLLLIFLLSQLLIFLIGNSHPLWLYATPLYLIAIFLMSFFRKRVVLPVYIVSLFSLLFLREGVQLFLVWVSAGIFNIFSFSSLSKGWRQFLNAILTFILTGVLYMAFCLVSDGNFEYNYVNLARLFVASFICVAVYPLVYLFEKLFSLVSVNRLEDLSDTNSPLLRLLARQAAGTYQHSLQVMNMAESAARAVGADVALTRAGALYHDVGKIQNPQCFVENQQGDNSYHEHLSYEESARDIIRHVADGDAIADKYGLPEVVRGFIRSHHGTSCTAYFYGKFVEAGGDRSRRPEFCYPGPNPHSIEETIVMICDSVEAASRTLRSYTDDSIRNLVDSIVGGKLAEGQFVESELSLSQLQTVKEEICDYLRQIHHARITYPKIKIK